MPRAPARSRPFEERQQMAAAGKVGTVVVAYPWDASDETLAPLRERLPDLRIEAAPYFGVFARHVPGASDTLDDAERAIWAEAEVAIALDVPKGLGEVAPNLRWIQAIGAGIDHLLEADLPANVTLTNAAGVAAAPIAEFAIGRLIEVWKRFDLLDEQQRT